MTEASLLYKTQTRRLFHAHIKLKISVFFEDSLLDELFAEFEKVDARYNSYSPNSYIHLINEHAGSFVEVDEKTVSLLKQVIELSDDLDGEFDMTIMPLIRAWGFYKNSDFQIPSAKKINDAKKKVNYKSVEFQNISVKIGKRQEIITGSFVKAFAVDEAVKKMKNMAISDAIINAGGSSIFALCNESHPSWPIEVNDIEGNPLFLLRIANASYSTSANVNTYVEIEGKRYGHIISPKTGFPSRNRQVGIVSKNTVEGDVISTGLFNCTKETFKSKIQFLSSKYGVEGFLIDEKGEIVFSDKFRKYIEKIN